MARARLLLAILTALGAACSDETSSLDAGTRADATAPLADAAPARDATVSPADARPADDAAATFEDAAAPRDDGISPLPDAIAPFDDAAAPFDDAEAPVDSGPAAVCGNGVEEAGEACDDGNAVDDGNGCSATCLREGSCGNGVVESLFEACDPGLTPCCASACDGPAVATTTCRAARNECDAIEACDGTSLACPADVPRDDGDSCTGCPLGMSCAGCFAGECRDPRTFCSDILARGQSTGDGVYVVQPAVTASVATDTSTLSVYCDMTTDGGGWTLVYKKSRTNAGDASVLWSGPEMNADLLSILDRRMASVDYSNAFQNRYWSAFSEARVEVVTGTITRAFVQFDLTGTTPLSWFSPTRHTASTWTDLPTAANFDNGAERAFRIPSGRSFYINRVWGGCPNDRGWLMISTINTCFWENATGSPTDIIYSRLTTEAHIPTAAQTGYADAFLVFLR